MIWAGEVLNVVEVFDEVHLRSILNPRAVCSTMIAHLQETGGCLRILSSKGPPFGTPDVRVVAVEYAPPRCVECEKEPLAAPKWPALYFPNKEEQFLVGDPFAGVFEVRLGDIVVSGGATASSFLDALSCLEDSCPLVSFMFWYLVDWFCFGSSLSS